MTEHKIEIPCNTEILIRVSCKEAEPISVIELLPSEPTPDPVISDLVIEAVPVPIPDPVTEPIPPKPVEPETLPDPLPPAEEIPNPLPHISDPVISPLPDPVPTPEPLPQEHCYCDLESPLSLPDFVKQLITLTKGLLYPSESDFPIEVLTKGFSSKMPPIKGIEVRTLDRVIPNFLRNVDPDDQQTGNVEKASLAARWQNLYDFIKHHSSVTAWHYQVKQNKYTHELMVLLLHPQGTVALRIKLVET